MKRPFISWMSCIIVAVSLTGCGNNSSPSGPGSGDSEGNGPAEPGNVRKFSISASRLELTWEDNSKDELGFIIERKPTGKSVFAVIDTVVPNITSYIVKAVPELPKPAAPAAIYRGLDGEYRVVSYNEGGGRHRSRSLPVSTTHGIASSGFR